MRVAVNVEQLLYRSPGGIGRYTARLVMLLPALYPGDEVIAFAARHPAAALRAAAVAAGLVDQQGEIISLRLPRPLLYEAWHLVGLPRLRIGDRTVALDVVHAPSVAVPPRGRTPLVVTVHDAAPALFPETFSRRGRRFHDQGLAAAARRADLVIAVSEAAAAEIVAHSKIPDERIRVVPNGIDRVEVPERQRRATLERLGLADAPYVLWVGSLEPRKGVGTLVAAMARVPVPGDSPESAPAGSAPAPRLVLAGYPGWLSDGLIDPIDRHKLGDRLRQLGPVDEADLWALYAGATLFALPSRHEGFGLPVLEAMGQRTPVVCSDIPALRQTAGDAAVFVAPGDVTAWSSVLADLLGDEGKRGRLAAAGFARSKQFSWERTVRATHAVYEEAAEMRSIPRARPRTTGGGRPRR